MTPTFRGQRPILFSTPASDMLHRYNISRAHTAKTSWCMFRERWSSGLSSSRHTPKSYRASNARSCSSCSSHLILDSVAIQPHWKTAQPLGDCHAKMVITKTGMLVESDHTSVLKRQCSALPAVCTHISQETWSCQGVC